MSLLRSVLLAGSESRWLRQRAVHYRFVRRAVSRFMPGEDLESALAATRELRKAGIGSVLTCLGENLKRAEEARDVARHYLEVLERSKREGLGAEISVKLTQLGLDLDRTACEAGLDSLLERAASDGTWVWIDMESSLYTDATLDIYRRARSRFPKVGVCVQSYLRRTARDLESLIAQGAGVRLVKGAYRESPDTAFPGKRDVDANYLALARRLIGPEARVAGVRAIFGTHDRALIRRIEEEAGAAGLAPREVEFQMLYGIQRQEQTRLASLGHPFRVLISYGDAWFPWYMRRLAERPANILFVLKNVFAG